MSAKRAALYVRVSTDAQTVENQIRELRQVAGRRGWDVVEVYKFAIFVLPSSALPTDAIQNLESIKYMKLHLIAQG
jgi:hypothetical protein